jgi:hypothetical protein
VTDLRDEVKRTLALLAAAAPGRSVEVRVPPFAATQCVEGPVHRRGKPGSVIECDPQTWLDLVHGRLTWAQALASGRMSATGERADLSPYLPLSNEGPPPNL